MKEASRNYIYQYKFFLYLSWTVLYFIFPAWRVPQIYISFTNEVIDIPYWHFTLGFFSYFIIAAVILNFSLKTLIVDKPLFVRSNGWFNALKNNALLTALCCTAVFLHIFTFEHIWGETVKHSSWIYNFLNSHWHRRFDLPVQYPAWLLLISLIGIFTQEKIVNQMSGLFNSGYSVYRSSRLVKFLFMVFLACAFLFYTKIVPPYSWRDHLTISGYPPLGTLLYLILYFLFGIKKIFLAPTIVQLAFYVLSGVFLYKTIYLFCKKETALLGAAIYMFSPLIFAYGAFGQLSSGTIFFIILVSYFFLKFIRDGENKDLILTLYFISIGCLYKRVVIIMFFVCCAYLIGQKLKQKDLRLINSIKILSLSFLSFMPWYLVGTRGADDMTLSQISKFDSLYSAFSILSSQLSWPVFLLIPASIIFIIIFRRDRLSMFFGLVFIAYYVLFSGVQQQLTHRYSMALYPTIAVFLAQFIYSAAHKIPWKHAFKLASFILIIYMAVLSVTPRSATNLVTFKYSDFEIQSFPFDDSVDWVLNETGDEKILTVLKQSNRLTSTAKNIPMGKFYHLPLGHIFTIWPNNDYDLFRKKLMNILREHEISYIMFPVSNAEIAHPRSNPKARLVMKYLKEDPYDDFIMTAKFNIVDNYIYIYKLKDSPIKKK